VINSIYRSAVPAQKYLPEQRSTAYHTFGCHDIERRGTHSSFRQG